MGVVWHTLTWVNEKGETVFDPSATGDEAECQRKEIDRHHYTRLVEVMKGSSRLSHWPGVGVSGRKPQVRNGVPPSDLF